jgi:hypothetical protein
VTDDPQKAQERQIRRFLRSRRKMTDADKAAERQRLKTLLVEKQAALDPIEAAMRRHPGLTREKAEEMVEAFGFG